MADSSFNGPTQSTVGIYLGEQRLVFSAPNPDLRLHDMETVELLEGPQGTLYGTGSIGGLLRMNPHRPDPAVTEGSVWASGTLTEHGEPGAELGGMVNLPLSETAAMRAVGYGGHAGGYIDDQGRQFTDVNSSEHIGGRLALALEPGPDWQIEILLSGEDTLLIGVRGRYVGRSFLDLDQQVRAEQGDYGLIDASISWDAGDFELALEGLNLTDSGGNRFAFGNPFTARLEQQVVPPQPRSVRLSLRADF